MDVSRLWSWLPGLGDGALKEDIIDYYGGTVDADDYLYRPLTGRSAIDIPAYDHEKMLAVAHHLDRSNMVAQRMLDILLDFVFGEGVRIQSQNDQVQEILDEHWNDPRNDWNKSARQIFRLLLRDGEVLLPVGRNPGDGKVRWGLIPSRSIREIVPDDFDWRLTKEIIVKPSGADQEPKRYTGIMWDVGEERLNVDVNTELLGLYLRANNEDGLRGIAWAYPKADYFDHLDQLAYNEVTRAILMRTFIWDVTVDGADDTEIERLKRDPSFQTPQPGSVRVHNGKIDWDAESPDLGTGESVQLLEFLLNTLLLGASGIPEHWFGSGGDVNRAVGSVMGQPTIKMLTRLQRGGAEWITTCLQFVVDYHVHLGKIDEMVAIQDSVGDDTDEMVLARDAFSVEMPDMDQADTNTLATALKASTETLLLAENQGYVSNRTAGRIWAAIASGLGVEVNPEEEQIIVEAETEAAEEKAAQMSPEQVGQQMAAMRPGTANGNAPENIQNRSGPSVAASGE